MSLVAAPFTAEFPHGTGKLRVLEPAAPCPKCGRTVMLVVVPLAAPESAACLGCTGPSSTTAVQTSGGAERSAAYVEWIERYIASQGDFVRGQCSPATIAMVAAFPELRRVCGFVRVSWGRDQHWWCVAPDGIIVDPTVRQFGAGGVLKYEELDPSDPATRAGVPTGVCMDCGDDVYGGATFCNEDCERATRRYLGLEVRP